jgi:hypothetical protein
MAGRGPAPKPADKRARRNKDPQALRVIEAEPQTQPKLPTSVKWHPQTRKWWAMWKASPLSDGYTANDWSELMDTALIHNAFWSGQTALASELRLRVAKFGATPEDRARLRITFAQANEADGTKPQASKPSRRTYGDLKVVGGSG